MSFANYFLIGLSYLEVPGEEVVLWKSPESSDVK